MRAELDLITAGFDKLPTLTANANKFIVVNSAATALTATSTLPTATVSDTTFTVQNTTDNTKTFQFLASGITAGTLRIYTMPDANTTLVGIGVTQTLTNKTLTAPVIATIVNTGTLTLPTSTDTLVGRATTDTLTNKTLTSPTINGGTLDNASVGATTAGTGAFTTLSASSTVSGTGFSTYLASPPAIGGTAAAAGAFTTLSASSTVSGTGFSTYLASPPAIGGTAPAAGAFTTLTATLDSTFSSTGALSISKGTTGQRPTPASGMLRFNTTTVEFEGYNGTAWASVGGAALSNDTSTATNVYPLFAAATSGTASTLYTGNASLLYKPSTGELKARVPVASNGIVVNSQTVATSYTIAAGFSAMSAGPITLSSGVVVTVTSGSRWVIQ
jgi:hypothetical protein